MTNLSKTFHFEGLCSNLILSCLSVQTKKLSQSFGLRMTAQKKESVPIKPFSEFESRFCRINCRHSKYQQMVASGMAFLDNKLLILLIGVMIRHKMIVFDFIHLKMAIFFNLSNAVSEKINCGVCTFLHTKAFLNDLKLRSSKIMWYVIEKF